jgi:hypothetical protein
MALELTLNYQKKIGLPGYSSHACSVSVNREILNLNEITDVIPETYRMLQEAVDTELKNAGWLPESGNGQPGVQNGNGNGNGHYAPVEADPGWSCTFKQQRLIERLCREQGIRDEDLAELAHNRCGKAPHGLTRLEASSLIDELLNASPRSRNGRYSGNGNGRRLKAEPVGKETCP